MCDTLLAAASETADGSVVFAKNSDRKDGEAQPFLQSPAANHPPGSSVVCTHVAIPQVSETYAVMGHSPWWVWGFEHGVNEHRVAIGNLTVFSREPVEEAPGLIGMDLVRLGLERGRTAREALEVIAALLEAHGQGGSALAPGASGYHNAFALADPAGCWLLETSGRHWAARQVTLDSHSNHLSIGDDWDISCRTLEGFARSSGWWQRAERIDVARAFRNPHVPGRISEGRLRRARELLMRRAGRIDAAEMRTILRDHLAGGPARLEGTTPDDETYYTLCMHSEPIGTTTASLIASLSLAGSEGGAPWPVWISFGTPCTGVFLPVYVDGVLPDVLARGGATPEADSAWWAFKRLQDAAAGDFAARTPVLRDAWTDFEAGLERERGAVERAAVEARRAGRHDDAVELLSDFMARTAAEAVKRADALAESIAA
ncbi:MAG TPA: C69 family dipeptidase [Myxococcota bacterium]|nr:C69 family dipeptidase [Myxococcota bacterium]